MKISLKKICNCSSTHLFELTLSLHYWALKILTADLRLIESKKKLLMIYYYLNEIF